MHLPDVNQTHPKMLETFPKLIFKTNNVILDSITKIISKHPNNEQQHTQMIFLKPFQLFPNASEHIRPTMNHSEDLKKLKKQDNPKEIKGRVCIKNFAFALRLRTFVQKFLT